MKTFKLGWNTSLVTCVAGCHQQTVSAQGATDGSVLTELASVVERTGKYFTDSSQKRFIHIASGNL
jgi:hypothetical protein